MHRATARGRQTSSGAEHHKLQVVEELKQLRQGIEDKQQEVKRGMVNAPAIRPMIDQLEKAQQELSKTIRLYN